MRREARYNALSGFDFRVLDDPEFKEDSVREEVIAPLLRALGYTSTPPFRIIRSRKLVHPFVSIGSATKKIHIVPDYLFEVDGRLAWTLEAKAPNEEILNSKHVEQAYSYAIHSEIRVPYFALCNGRHFVLYHVSKERPVIDFDLRALPNYWDNLLALLSPPRVLDYEFRLGKDFGLHLKRLGFDAFESLIFPDVPIGYIGRLGPDLYSFGSGLKLDGQGYVVTFDFDSAILSQLRERLPDDVLRRIREAPSDAVTVVQFADVIYRINVDSRVGTTLAENEDEIFLPMWVNRILG